MLYTNVSGYIQVQERNIMSLATMWDKCTNTFSISTVTLVDYTSSTAHSQTSFSAICNVEQFTLHGIRHWWKYFKQNEQHLMI